ncbi:MAG: branched-chain amino acid aminotransferase [wastewater metagenome]|nr:branched-chain amino acid aminotransferase [Candidatus Loosdrechtia aerotolerans]
MKTIMSCAIFLNDKIIEETEGLLSTLDRGFLYGDGLFETFRTYGKKLFRLEDHVARLSNSAQYFDIPFHYTLRQIQCTINQLLDRDNLADAYIRMTLSRGYGIGGLIPAEIKSPTFVIHVKPLAAYPDILYRTGMSLVTSRKKRSTTCPLSHHKTLNFLTNYLMKKDAIEKGAHDTLILNTDNYITECTVSNIFIVEKDILITPSLHANILPGVTRKIVLELCKENTVDAVEELFTRERVLGADEIFITNSLMEIMPVSKVDGQLIGKHTPGPLTEFLQDKYKKQTELLFR